MHMKALVIYGSRHGNTQKVAEAIGTSLGTLGTVQLMAVDTVTPAALAGADLIVVGGPTEAHGMSVPLKQFFAALPGGAMKGKIAAAFDTRLDMARWLSGSAASGIEGHLRKAGAELVGTAASFAVKGKDPELRPGEIARAGDWSRGLARVAATRLGASSQPVEV
jgi:flavodoxin